jgi:hypothetical protein
LSPGKPTTSNGSSSEGSSSSSRGSSSSDASLADEAEAAVDRFLEQRWAEIKRDIKRDLPPEQVRVPRAARPTVCVQAAAGMCGVAPVDGGNMTT